MSNLGMAYLWLHSVPITEDFLFHLPASFLGPVPPSLTVLSAIALLQPDLPLRDLWVILGLMSSQNLPGSFPWQPCPFCLWDQAYFSSKNYPFEKLFSLKYLSLSSLSRHHCFLLTCAEHLPSAKSVDTQHTKNLCSGRVYSLIAGKHCCLV